MGTQENTRLVKGIWIPIEIWEAEDLSWNEKLLLMEIDSFTSKDKDCYISNEYISNMLGVTERSARRLMSSLVEKGYVIRTRFDGRKRFIKSNLCGRYAKKEHSREEQNVPSGRTQMSVRRGHKCPHTNIEYTNSNIPNNIKNIKKETALPKFDFYDELQKLGVSEEVAQDWRKVRKDKKATDTETAFKSVAKEIAKSGKPADECIRVAVVNCWRGFKAEWLENLERPSTQPATQPYLKGHRPSVYDNNRAVAEQLMRQEAMFGEKGGIGV